MEQNQTILNFKMKSFTFVTEVIGAVDLRRVNLLLADRKEHLLPISNPFPMPFNFRNEIDQEKETIKMDKAERELNAIKEAIDKINHSPGDMATFPLAKESIERRINIMLRMFGCNKIAAF